MKIGIPQALLFYKYYPFWSELLKGMGQDVMQSPPTNKRILGMGVEVAENELCLPIKVFYGHALELKDKVDAILVPRIVSVEKDAYTCPKFLGIPDMIRSVEKMPRVLSPTVNRKKGRLYSYLSVLELAEELGVGKVRATLAFRKARVAQKNHEKTLISGVPPTLSWGRKFPISSEGIPIGVVGHPYNIYDNFITLNLIERLGKMGAKIVTPEMSDPRIILNEARKMPKELFWSYEKEVLGTVKKWFRTNEVAGIIYILAFCCGPDSMVQVLIEKEARQHQSIPLMSLVIDEHSGEAGLITRIEAFMDMIKRKETLRLGSGQEMIS